MEFDESDIRDQLSQLMGDDDVAGFERLYVANPRETEHDAWLVDAAFDGKLEFVDLLLKLGRDPNERSQDSTGMGPICCACNEGHVDVVKRLLEAKVDISVDNIDDNCLFGAIYSESLPIAKLLINAGIDIHKTYDINPTRRKNALLFAEERGCKDIAELLRARGATLPEQPSKVLAIKERRATIEQVLSHFFGSETVEPFAKIAGSGKPGEEIEIVRIDAEQGFPFQTFATIGVSAHAVPVKGFGPNEIRIEFLVHIPFSWSLKSPVFDSPEFQWPIEWLKTVAKNFVAKQIQLNGQHNIISNGDPAEPLGQGTQQSCLLLISDFYDFSPTDVGDGKPIHFFHIVPLYASERDFEKKQGVVKLLEAMSEIPTSLVVSPARKPFVGS